MWIQCTVPNNPGNKKETIGGGGGRGDNRIKVLSSREGYTIGRKGQAGSRELCGDVLIMI